MSTKKQSGRIGNIALEKSTRSYCGVLHRNKWLAFCACFWLSLRPCAGQILVSTQPLGSGEDTVANGGVCSPGQSLLQFNSKPLRSQVTGLSDIDGASGASPVSLAARTQAVLLQMARRVLDDVRSRNPLVLGVSAVILATVIAISCLALYFRSSSPSTDPSSQTSPASSVHPPIAAPAAGGPSSPSTDRSPQTAPARSVPPAAGGPTLCPGLVVPAHNDCVIVFPLLPRLQSGASGCDNTRLDILDVEGRAVFKASVVKPWPALGRPVVTLSAKNTSPRTECLAICRATGSSGGRKVQLFDKEDILFGILQKEKNILQKERPRYVLGSNRGSLQLRFDGNFKDYRVNIFDSWDNNLARTEQCSMPFDSSGRFCKIRIAAGADVSLILCGLLAIDALEAADDAPAEAG